MAQNTSLEKPILHVEILQRRRSVMAKDVLMHEVDTVLKNMGKTYVDSHIKEFPNSGLQEHILHIKICEVQDNADVKEVELSNVMPRYYVYQLECDGPGIEELNEGEEEIPAATYWILPAAEFDNYWENLVFDTNIKEELLNYIRTTLLFSDRKICESIISWNKVVLLHGPPGTGKTTLSKALAQKLSIRLEPRYKYAQLVEINSHSLFSKWFSESGKLVQKMFTKITEMVEDPQSLVLVLIDEVESLTCSRASCSNGTEPSDAVRVVNAVLTQLDQLKKYPNCLILTTSNITGTIDLAFVDRADIKQYLGLPSKGAIYQIYHSCILELERTGIIVDSERLFTLKELTLIKMAETKATQPSLLLMKIAEQSQGLSGRTLRKIPFLAHALYIHTPRVSLYDFLFAMEKAVQKQLKDREKMST
ncbi:pachytene checkpoint protein 2 homolog [Penaeus indicus]|uniref:pachytene checkpoint protein 2 homolog n=1 Tax=Penaeus indicus TaxID=29960 RepID=UPI00300C939C